MPQPRSALQPTYVPTLAYPRAAYAAKIEGAVIIGFDLTSLGHPINLRVLSATPQGVFDGEARRFVQHSEFQIPASPHAYMNQSMEVVFNRRTAQPEPVPARPVRIFYPERAEEDHAFGDCHTEFWIEPNGTTSNARILYCSPSGYFEQATLDAIKNATYKLEDDPSLNQRRLHRLDIAFRFFGVPESDARYLKPDEWIRLRYTLTPDGHARDIEVIAKSSEHLPTKQAREQLNSAIFAPVIENGQAIEQKNRTIDISGN